jgi:hypothetical protein
VGLESTTRGFKDSALRLLWPLPATMPPPHSPTSPARRSWLTSFHARTMPRQPTAAPSRLAAEPGVKHPALADERPETPERFSQGTARPLGPQGRGVYSGSPALQGRSAYARGPRVGS